MRGSTAVIFSILAFLTMLLASCGSGGGGRVSENRSNRGYNPGVGPFDSRGNYVERWANDKSKGVWWRKGSTSGPSAVTPPVVASNVTPIPSPRPVAQPTATRPTPPVGGTATPTPRPRPAVASRPTPKPRVKKVTPKRKPPIRYTVKSGDTLWRISQKYKASVTSIQRANGLKGTNLKIGRRLLIPRY